MDYIAGQASPSIRAIDGNRLFREAKHANIISKGY